MIRLFGSLARKVKRRYPLIDPKNIPCVVHSAAEAIRALESQLPGFKTMIRRKGYYRVVRGEDVTDDSKALPQDQLTMQFSETVWNFLPCAAGAGGKVGMALLLVVVGIVLIVVAIYGGPPGWAIASQGAGWWGAAAAGMIAAAGVGLLVGGLTMLITPTPEMPTTEGGEDDNSYLFNGALNVNTPGVTIPVAYGETFIGSVVTSFGVSVSKYSD